jgi:hypothetical protein
MSGSQNLIHPICEVVVIWRRHQFAVNSLHPAPAVLKHEQSIAERLQRTGCRKVSSWANLLLLGLSAKFIWHQVSYKTIALPTRYQ